VISNGLPDGAGGSTVAWRVMIEKNTSTRLHHVLEVAVKCSVIRRFRARQARAAGGLWWRSCPPPVQDN